MNSTLLKLGIITSGTIEILSLDNSKSLEELKNTIEKETEEKREFKTVCTERLPDEMDLADYLRAVGRM